MEFQIAIKIMFAFMKIVNSLQIHSKQLRKLRQLNWFLTHQLITPDLLYSALMHKKENTQTCAPSFTLTRMEMFQNLLLNQQVSSIPQTLRTNALKRIGKLKSTLQKLLKF